MTGRTGTTDRDRGAAAWFYNPLTLRLYDAGVLGLTNRWIWRCPTPQLQQLYRESIGGRHLDIGPGTGFYLESTPAADITLLDLNQASLSAARRRIEDTSPETAVQCRTQSFFDPVAGRFDSIAVNFLLHCIPGQDKWRRLAELRDNLEPGGRLFGSTVVLDPDTATVPARILGAVYNRLGVFGNRQDSAEQLEQALAGFAEYEVRRIGQVLVFRATAAG